MKQIVVISSIILSVMACGLISETVLGQPRNPRVQAGQLPPLQVPRRVNRVNDSIKTMNSCMQTHTCPGSTRPALPTVRK